MKNVKYFDIAQGNIPGYKTRHKFGRNPSVSTAGFEAIWNGGSEYTGFNATEAETVTITSSDDGDTADGAGLRTIRLYGLGPDGKEQKEDIVLNGTVAVTSTKEYIRLDTARGLTAGTNKYNIGSIVIAQSVTTANIFAVVPAGYNSTMIAAYTIPSDKIGYITSQRAALANKNAASAAVRLQVRAPGTVFTVAGEAALNSAGTTLAVIDFAVPQKIPPMTDIFIEAYASSDVAITAFLDIILVDIE